jgi:hypothetical protein
LWEGQLHSCQWDSTVHEMPRWLVSFPPSLPPSIHPSLPPSHNPSLASRHPLFISSSPPPSQTLPSLPPCLGLCIVPPPCFVVGMGPSRVYGLALTAQWAPSVTMLDCHLAKTVTLAVTKTALANQSVSSARLGSIEVSIDQSKVHASGASE